MNTVTGIPAAILQSRRKETAPPVRARTRLRVNEIFFSLQANPPVWECPIRVRAPLTGCLLRCGYCDTAYAFHEGEHAHHCRYVLTEVATHATRTVCVTGEKPLAQKSCLTL